MPINGRGNFAISVQTRGVSSCGRIVHGADCCNQKLRLILTAPSSFDCISLESAGGGSFFYVLSAVVSGLLLFAREAPAFGKGFSQPLLIKSGLKTWCLEEILFHCGIPQTSVRRREPGAVMVGPTKAPLVSCTRLRFLVEGFDSDPSPPPHS